MRYKLKGYTLENVGLLLFRGHMYVPKNDNIRRLVMEESHKTHYFPHVGVRKIHEDLNKIFF